MTAEIRTRPEEQEARELVAKASVLENEAKALTITDTESYEKAAAFKQAIKTKRDEIMAKPLDKKAAAHGVWKFLSEICNMVVRPFDQAEAIVDRKMIDYRDAVQRKRDAEARKAREKAEADARKKREEEIRKAKELGDKEAAKNLKDAPLEIKATAPKTPEPPKVSGMHVRKIWKFKVDVNKLDRRWMIANETAIGVQVRALGAAHGISGVTAYQEEVQ